MSVKKVDLKPGEARPSCNETSPPGPHSSDRLHDLDEVTHERPHTRSFMNARDVFQRNTGLFFITVSQCCFSSMNVAVKKLNSMDPPVPTMELIAVRMALTGLFSLSYMIVTGVNDPFLGPKALRSLLLLRGSVGFIGLVGIYFSLHYLSLSDATALMFLAPMFIIFTGAIFLGESFSGRQVFAGLMSFGGVLMIARPTFLFGPDSPVPHLWRLSIDADPTDGANRLIGVGASLLGVVGATAAYTTIRAIGKRAHAMHSMVYFSATCVVGSTTSMLLTKTSVVVPTRIEWLVLLILIGVFGFLAQLLFTMGLQRETASRGSMAMYTQIVFATIFERIFFHAYPTFYSAIGIILITGSALYTALSKPKETKKTGPIRLPDDDVERGQQVVVDADAT